MSREFLPGQVIAYPIFGEHERGETGGRKTRSTCVVFAGSWGE